MQKKRTFYQIITLLLILQSCSTSKNEYNSKHQLDDSIVMIINSKITDSGIDALCDRNITLFKGQKKLNFNIGNSEYRGVCITYYESNLANYVNRKKLLILFNKDNPVYFVVDPFDMVIIDDEELLNEIGNVHKLNTKKYYYHG